MRLTIGKVDRLFVVWAVLLFVALEYFLPANRLTFAVICIVSWALVYALRRVRAKSGDGLVFSFGSEPKKTKN
jgi:hypothetical protein